MSIFNKPALNFSGFVDFHVGTANNGVTFPVAIYDPIHGRAYLPPRFYVDLPGSLSKAQVKAIKPDVVFLVDPYSDTSYFEIRSIDTEELFLQWAITPLGSSPLDTAYHALYALLPDIYQVPPGYWNYMGDMGVYLREVSVKGVEMLNDNQLITYTHDHCDDAEINALLGSSLSADSPYHAGYTTAVITDVAPTLAIYSQIFASLYTLKKDGTTLLEGIPWRASSGIFNFMRVQNWVPAMGASADFTCAIPRERISQPSPLLDFFDRHTPKNGVVKGIRIRLNALEVIENKVFSEIYQKGNTFNPARASLMGSICPWYEGDMRSVELGRLLVNWWPDCTAAVRGLYMGPQKYTPFLVRLCRDLPILQLNLLNSLIEIGTPPPKPDGSFPTRQGEVHFETYTLGLLALWVMDQGREYLIGAPFRVDANTLSRKTLEETGGQFALTFDPELREIIQRGQLILKYQQEEKWVTLLKETDYYITTDQMGLYTEQGDSCEQGYYVYDERKCPLTIRLLERGLPVRGQVSCYLVQYLISDTTLPPMEASHVEKIYLTDNQEVTLDNSKGTAVYYFVTPAQKAAYESSQNWPPKFNDGMVLMDSGAFVVLRVLPKQDYDQFLDPTHPQYRPPTFDDLYTHIFQTYTLIYPAMSHVMPFTKEYFDNGTMAGEMVRRVQMKSWGTGNYMPRTRELSQAQRQLIYAWAQHSYQVNIPSSNDPTTL
ncbi:MAG: hypothetical protein ACFCUI_10695 [Bernardetiaceae bacterium]